MNVGELKKILALLPDDLPILVAADSEGNSFRALQDAEEAFVLASDADAWEIEGLISDDDADEYEEDELTSRLVFWP